MLSFGLPVSLVRSQGLRRQCIKGMACCLVYTNCTLGTWRCRALANCVSSSYNVFVCYCMLVYLRFHAGLRVLVVVQCARLLFLVWLFYINYGVKVVGGFAWGFLKIHDYFTIRVIIWEENFRIKPILCLVNLPNESTLRGDLAGFPTLPRRNFRSRKIKDADKILIPISQLSPQTFHEDNSEILKV